MKTFSLLSFSRISLRKIKPVCSRDELNSYADLKKRNTNVFHLKITHNDLFLWGMSCYGGFCKFSNRNDEKCDCYENEDLYYVHD